MVPYKLSPQDWEVAMMKLRDRHKSILIYGLLRNLLEGKWSGFELWVDCWPEFKSIVAKPSGEEILDPHTGKFYFVDSDDVSSMTSLLDDPRIITWNDDINICVTKCVWPVLRQRGEQKGTFEDQAHAPIYTVSRDTLVDISPPEVYTVGKIGDDVIAHVTENWDHTVPGLDQYVKVLAERNFPSICFRDPTGALVAYAVTQFHNLLGMLHVLPEFRGQGFGTAAMSQLAKETLKKQEVVGVLVQDSNPVSLHMHQKLGFKLAPDSVQHWVLYTVNPQTQK